MQYLTFVRWIIYATMQADIENWKGIVIHHLDVLEAMV